MMRLISIQSGMPKTYGNASKTSFDDREWRTGFYKRPISGVAEVGRLGIVGDGQADLRVHGGPDKAICVYPSEHFSYWRAILGHEMQAGAFGENFTTAERVEKDVCIGDTFQVNELVLQVTQPRQPCWKIARRWGVRNLSVLTQDSGRTGWYFRVLRGGEVEAPEKMRLVDRPNSRWTIEKCNQVMHRLKKDRDQALALANIPELSESWQSSLLRRARGDQRSSEEERLYGESGNE